MLNLQDFVRPSTPNQFTAERIRTSPVPRSCAYDCCEVVMRKLFEPGTGTKTNLHLAALERLNTDDVAVNMFARLGMVAGDCVGCSSHGQFLRLIRNERW